METIILKYSNKKKLTKNLVINYIENLLDFNQVKKAKKAILFFEKKYIYLSLCE